MKRSRYVYVILMFFISIILVGCDLSENGDGLADNEVKVKNAESTFVGTNFEDVVEKLEGWGFTNIETEIVYDIVWGITPEGSTKSVSIDGSNQFKNGDVFVHDVLVVVTYSMRASDDPAKQKYEITWKNEDGTVLKTDELFVGTIPVYNGNKPTKPATNQKKYVFDGWTPEIEAVSGNQTYTATYLEVDNLFTITYDLDGGMWDLGSSESIMYHGLITTTIPEREGYEFAGWVIKGFLFDTDFDITTRIEEDYTLTATWDIAEYVVVYNLDGGTWSRSTEQTISHNSLITSTTPTKDGHEFVGWLLNDELFDTTHGVTSDLSLTAQWYLPNYEDILVGRWEGVYASSEAYGFTFIEFDGYFHDQDGQRKSGLRDFDYHWGSFTLYGNKMGIYYIDAGTIYFTISYDNESGRLIFKNENYPDIVMQRTTDEPNSLAWKWNHLYEFAKTQSEAKVDQYGLYYEIEMNLEQSNLSPLSKQVITSRQILKVYQDKFIAMFFYYEGLTDPNIDMIVNVAFEYETISNNRIIDTYISIVSEGYIMETNKAVIEFEFDEDNVFWFTFSNLEENGNNFPISSSSVLGDLDYFSRTVMFNFADFLLKEHQIDMFTR